MVGRSGMGVAGFRRVGGVILGALGPVDVVIGRAQSSGAAGAAQLSTSWPVSSSVAASVSMVPASAVVSSSAGFFLDRVFFSRLLDRFRGGRLGRFSGQR